MSKKATRKPAEQLPQNPDQAVRPENHPGDVRTYPDGSKIAGGTLELPTSGVADGSKAQAAFDAAVARREGQPYETEGGVNIGTQIPPIEPATLADDVAELKARQAFGLVAAVAEDREKGEQNVNSGSLLKPQEEVAPPPQPASFVEMIKKLGETLTPEQVEELRQHFTKADVAATANEDPAAIGKAMQAADETAKRRRMEVRDEIEAEVVRHEKAFDDLVSGACQTDSPLTSDAIRQLRLTARDLVDEADAPIEMLERILTSLTDVKFDYPQQKR